LWYLPCLPQQQVLGCKADHQHQQQRLAEQRHPIPIDDCHRLLAVDRCKTRVTRAGSVVPLLRNVSLFLLQ